MAIPGCQLDHIWNELLSRAVIFIIQLLGLYIYEGSPVTLIWRLGERSLRLNLRVRGHLGLKVWWNTPLIWATTSAGDNI